MKKKMPQLGVHIFATFFFLLLTPRISASVDVSVGAWSDCFTNAYLCAIERHTPIVVFYGNESCDHCNNMSVAIETDVFREWMSERLFYFVKKHVPYYFEHYYSFPGPFANSTAYPDTWMAAHWCCCALKWNEDGIPETQSGNLSALPIIRVYWLTADGLEKGTNFLGRIGSMPVTEPSGNSYDTLARQLMASIDLYTSDYVPDAGYNGGGFALSGTEVSHLEAEIGRTEFVDVPLSRTVEESATAGSATFRADFGSHGDPVEQLVEWGVGEQAKMVRVEIPLSGEGFTDGETIELSLLDDGDGVRATNVLRMVAAPANASTNPHWIGRFDEATLPFGEWTMDLDVATNKVRHADGEAYTVVLFSGALWCPYCKGLDKGVLESEDFKSFVREKNAALVLLDNPRRSPDAEPTVPNGAPPTLLRYAEAAKDGASGAAYLSRNMISRNEAEAILQRNHNLGYTDLGSGGFRTPGAARVGYPTLFVLCKDGTVAGKLSSVYTKETAVTTNDTIVTTNTTYVYDTAVNMERLQALFDVAAEMNYRGGDFAVTDYEKARLEAEIGGTETVYVPLVRKDSVVNLSGTNTLHVSFADKAESLDLPVSWGAGEQEKGVPVAIPTAEFTEGDRLTLVLRDGEGVDVATNHVTMVEPLGVLPDNPHWVGDFTPEELPWGEWTFDYDAATNKAARFGGHVMAVFTGPLWCPDCFGAGESLFSPTNESFYAWMRSNKIIPVVFDQGRGSNPATAAGTLAPRLTTYLCDPRKTGENSVSGAAYLSRHGLYGGDSAVKAVIDRTTEKTGKWLAPEHSATTARIGNPKMLFVRNDRVTARVREHEDAKRMFDPAENLGRLRDALLLDTTDSPGEAPAYRTTTTLSHSVGTSDALTLQINDNQRFYSLSNVPAGAITFRAGGAGIAARDLTLSLYDGAQVVATGANALVVTNLSSDVSNLHLCAATYEDGKTKYFVDEGLATSVALFTVTSSCVLLPINEVVEYVPVAERVTIAVEEGREYVLDGFDAGSVAEAFTPSENADGVYVAKATGEIELAVSDGAETIAYGCYRAGGDDPEHGDDANSPGMISIVGSVPERTEGDTTFAKEGSAIELVLARVAGIQGDASATLETTAGTLSQSTFAWTDGAEETTRTATLSLPTIEDCPSRKVVVSLVGGESTKTDGSSSRLVVRLMPVAAPCFSESAVALSAVRSVVVSAETPVEYAGEGEVKVVLVEGALPPGVLASYNASEGKFVVSGVPKRTGEYAAVFRASAVDGRTKTSGGGIRVEITVVDAASGGSGHQASPLADWQVKTWSNVPVVDVSARRLAGLLTLTVPASGKVSGKYITGEKTVTFNAAGWSGLDERSVWLDVAGSDAAHVLHVALTGGTVPVVALTDMGGESLDVLMSAVAWSKENPATAWRGCYTAGFYHMAGSANLPKGHIPLSLRMTDESACEKGRFVWAGYLPDGRAVSGTTTLQGDADGMGTLPILCRTASGVFSSVMSMEPDGAALHQEPEHHAENHRLVQAYSSVDSSWMCGDSEAVYIVFGQYYDPEESIKDCIFANGVTDNAEFFVSCADGRVKIADVLVGDDALSSGNSAVLSISVLRDSGFVGGTYSDPATGAMRNWRGVLLNGWTGCNCDRFDLPLVLGFHWGEGGGSAVELDTIPSE